MSDEQDLIVFMDSCKMILERRGQKKQEVIITDDQR